jgi:hypothetical protein
MRSHLIFRLAVAVLFAVLFVMAGRGERPRPRAAPAVAIAGEPTWP